MKKYLNLKILILSLFFISTSVFSQVNSSDKIKMNKAAKEAETKAENLPWYEKKINSIILDKIDKMIQEDAKSKYSGKMMSEKYSDPIVNVDEVGMIKLKVELFDTSSRDDFNNVIDQLKKIGGKIHQSYYPQANIKWYPEIHCYIVYDMIKEIAKDKRIANINISDQYAKRTGSVTTEGDVQLSAQLARTQHGVDGSGVKVGVISFGVTSYDNSRSNGDLPNVYFVTSNQHPDDEGTAMMEIVYDLAPGCELAFGDFEEYQSSTGMATIISDLVTYGCKIIVDDVAIFDDPWFSDGALAQTIYNKIDYNNITYISAAGNDGISMWGENFTGDANNWHIFYDNGQNSYIQNGFELPDGETAKIYLQWADEWDDAINNYDLYLYSPAHGTFIGSGGKTVQGDGNNQHPFEALSYTNNLGYKTWFYIQLKRVSGESRELKVTAYPYELEYTKPDPSSITSNQIYGHPATLDVISVAAYPAQNQTILEDYSSRGPSKIWTYPGGTFETRITPTITATDNCVTSVPGFNPFPGTSAAAPHIAGIAALYYEKHGVSTNQQNFYNDLTANADGIAGGTGGTWNNQSGFGKANAFEALGGGSFNVIVNQLDKNNSPIDAIWHWENNDWNDYWDLPHTFEWDENSQQTLEAARDVVNGQKYIRWEDNNYTVEYKNHNSFTITQNMNSLTSYLEHTKTTTIKTVLTSGGSGGNIEFKDPWYEDFNEAPYGYRNRGTSAIFHPQPSPLNLTLASAYKGVFLNQNYTQPGKPFYSVRAAEWQEFQAHGEDVTGYFLNWEASGADLQSPYNLTTPVVFRQDNAEVKALYKGHLASGSSAATASNDQRKIAQDSNGNYHLVYEDGGEIYYTSSSNGVYWFAEQRISEGNGNNIYPSISIGVSDKYHIVWQRFMGGNIYWIKYKKQGVSGITDVGSSTLSDVKPVITTLNLYDFVCIVWNDGSGLKFKVNNDMLGWSDLESVPNTNGSCLFPTIIGDAPLSYATHLAWQKSNDIYYQNMHYYMQKDKYFFSWHHYKNITSMTNANRYPSISVSSDYKPVVAWRGVDDDETLLYRKKSSMSSSNWGTLYSFKESNIDNSPAIATYSESATDVSIVWKTSSNQIKVVTKEDDEWGDMQTVASNGYDPNISTQGSHARMVFRKYNSLPYLIKTESTGLLKGTSSNYNISRTEVFPINAFQKGDSLNFHDVGKVVFEIESISKDSSIYIPFTSINDTLLDEPFFRTGTINTSSKIKLRFDVKFIDVNLQQINANISNYQGDLITVVLKDSKTNRILRRYHKFDIYDFLKNKPIKDVLNINLGNFINTPVYIDILFNLNPKIKFEQQRKIAYEDNVTPTNKTFSTESSIVETQLITEFNLSDCYPNPFNPVTTITFDIPEKSDVKIKVYDIQGKVVAELFNGRKDVGRYTVQFDGSNISSGVYFYEMVAGNYREVRKMMLVK